MENNIFGYIIGALITILIIISLKSVRHFKQLYVLEKIENDSHKRLFEHFKKSYLDLKETVNKTQSHNQILAEIENQLQEFETTLSCTDNILLATNKRQEIQGSKIESLEKRIETLTERVLIHEAEIANNFASKQEKPDEIKWIKRDGLIMNVEDFDKIQEKLFALDQLMNLEDFCEIYLFTPTFVQIRKFDGSFIKLKVVTKLLGPKDTRIFPLDFFKESD